MQNERRGNPPMAIATARDRTRTHYAALGCDADISVRRPNRLRRISDATD